MVRACLIGSQETETTILRSNANCVIESMRENEQFSKF